MENLSTQMVPSAAGGMMSYQLIKPFTLNLFQSLVLAVKQRLLHNTTRSHRCNKHARARTMYPVSASAGFSTSSVTVGLFHLLQKDSRRVL